MSTPTVFPLLPHGGQPTIERLEWLTDVSIALDGSEPRRRALRSYPRLTYRATFNVFGSKSLALMDILRTGSTVLAPLFPHTVAGGLTIDAGLAVDNTVLVSTGGVVTQQTLPLANPAAASWYAPADLAWIAPSRDFAWTSSAFATASQLEFQMQDHREVVTAWAGPTSNGLPLWPTTTDWTTSPSEKVQAEADVADYGHLRLYEQRYVKRTLTVPIVLTSRADILAFRQFLFMLRGRYQAFRYTFPGDVEKTYRLGTDTVEISYTTRSFATASLEFVEVTQ